MLCYTILYYTILYYTKPYYTMLYSYYTILYSFYSNLYSFLGRQRLSDTEASWDRHPSSSVAWVLQSSMLTNQKHSSLFCTATVFSWVRIKLCSECFEKMGHLLYYRRICNLSFSVLLLKLTIELSSWSRPDHITKNRCLGRGQSERLLTSTT